MSHIAFVAAAYAFALGATGLLVGWAWLSMRRAERAVKKLRDHGD
jgi:hypothetical protein